MPEAGAEGSCEMRKSTFKTKIMSATINRALATAGARTEHGTVTQLANPTARKEQFQPPNRDETHGSGPIKDVDGNLPRMRAYLSLRAEYFRCEPHSNQCGHHLGAAVISSSPHEPRNGNYYYFALTNVRARGVNQQITSGGRQIGTHRRTGDEMRAFRSTGTCENATQVRVSPQQKHWRRYQISNSASRSTAAPQRPGTTHEPATRFGLTEAAGRAPFPRKQMKHLRFRGLTRTTFGSAEHPRTVARRVGSG